MPGGANAGLALLAAGLWGGGDFSGGMGVGAAGGKTSGALRVVMLSHFATLCALIIALLVRGDGLPHGTAIAWGLLAGLCAGISLTSFYMALARGQMGASAAISGLLAAAIPALASALLEGRPSALKIAGFVIAAIAIWMIAAGPSGQHAVPGTMGLAIIAGIGFGVYFTALRMANPLGIVMPMALARVGSLVTCAIMFGWLALRGTASGARITARAAGWALAAGSLDTCGNLLFVAATRAGRLDVAAVLASLYPASTIVLARWVLHERLTHRQLAGMLVAVAAVVMITI